jgi:type VI protein secretion system component VasF
MRHLKKFNESSNIEDTKRDIIDNFSYLIDTLGDPIISNKNWGDKHKWVIKFNLEMDISLMN